jgi:hypothetical protein
VLVQFLSPTEEVVIAVLVTHTLGTCINSFNIGSHGSLYILDLIGSPHEPTHMHCLHVCIYMFGLGWIHAKRVPVMDRCKKGTSQAELTQAELTREG